MARRSPNLPAATHPNPRRARPSRGGVSRCFMDPAPFCCAPGPPGTLIFFFLPRCIRPASRLAAFRGQAGFSPISAWETPTEASPSRPLFGTGAATPRQLPRVPETAPRRRGAAAALAAAVPRGDEAECEFSCEQSHFSPCLPSQGDCVASVLLFRFSPSAPDSPPLPCQHTAARRASFFLCSCLGIEAKLFYLSLLVLFPNAVRWLGRSSKTD